MAKKTPLYYLEVYWDRFGDEVSATTLVVETLEPVLKATTKDDNDALDDLVMGIKGHLALLEQALFAKRRTLLPRLRKGERMVAVNLEEGQAFFFLDKASADQQKAILEHADYEVDEDDAD